MKNKNDRKNIPIGLTMAMSKNLNAMERFYSMSENEQMSVIEKTRDVKSKNEMQAFVDNGFEF